MTWPAAELDAVRRLRVLAAATPGAACREALIPAPFDAVWDIAGDLERALPLLLHDVRSVRLTQVDGERFEALVRGHSGLRARFDVVLRPGWCWMQSRFLLGGMAAVPAGDGTGFAFLGGVRAPWVPRPLADLAGGPVAASAIRRLVRLAG